jgi:hypothetical protein
VEQGSFLTQVRRLCTGRRLGISLLENLDLFHSSLRLGDLSGCFEPMIEDGLTVVLAWCRDATLLDLHVFFKRGFSVFGGSGRFSQSARGPV